MLQIVIPSRNDPNSLIFCKGLEAQRWARHACGLNKLISPIEPCIYAQIMNIPQFFSPILFNKRRVFQSVILENDIVHNQKPVNPTWYEY